jgi:hypothetical protein
LTKGANYLDASVNVLHRRLKEERPVWVMLKIPGQAFADLNEAAEGFHETLEEWITKKLSSGLRGDGEDLGWGDSARPPLQGMRVEVLRDA